MKRINRFRPSPAMVVAMIALFVALGGGATAGTVLLITGAEIKNNTVASADIKNGTVNSKDIKNNSVRTQDVRNGTLLAEDFKAGQLPTGATGPAGQAGPAGPAGPLVETVPSGLTLRGYFFVGGTAAAGFDLAGTSIPFGFQLSSAPTPHFINQGATPPADCPGTAAAPSAAPGHLCVYETSQENAGIRDVTSIPGGDGTAKATGAGVFVRSTAAGDFSSQEQLLLAPPEIHTKHREAARPRRLIGEHHVTLL